MSNIYTRATLAGEFPVINENLVRILIKRKLWSNEIRKKIIAFDGSIQKINEIPKNIKETYKTAFEVYQKDIITMAAERGPFIDQSQSMNLFMDKPNFDILSNCHLYSWECGLKTGMYYLRSKPATKPIQFGIDVDQLKEYLSEQPKNKKNKATDDNENKLNVESLFDSITIPKEYEEKFNSANIIKPKTNKGRNVDTQDCEHCSS